MKSAQEERKRENYITSQEAATANVIIPKVIFMSKHVLRESVVKIMILDEVGSMDKESLKFGLQVYGTVAAIGLFILFCIDFVKTLIGVGITLGAIVIIYIIVVTVRKAEKRGKITVTQATVFVGTSISSLLYVASTLMLFIAEITYCRKSGGVKYNGNHAYYNTVRDTYSLWESDPTLKACLYMTILFVSLGIILSFIRGFIKKSPKYVKGVSIVSAAIGIYGFVAGCIGSILVSVSDSSLESGGGLSAYKVQSYGLTGWGVFSLILCFLSVAIYCVTLYISPEA